MCYLLCSAGTHGAPALSSREWCQAAQGAAACCANTAFSCIFSLCSPSSPYFSMGFQHYHSQLSPNIFKLPKNYFRSPGDTGSNLMSFPSQQLASSLLLREKMPGNDSFFFNLWCSFENWSFLSSAEDNPPGPSFPLSSSSRTHHCELFPFPAALSSTEFCLWPQKWACRGRSDFQLFSDTVK